jgi:NhaP-type Na+/H+ or K+/H+ antiporter
MKETIQTLFLLLGVLVAVAVLAERLKTAPSILLVVAGIALALVPGLPRVERAPELVLLVILPPLIYTAGVQMSGREFRFNLRPIALLAVGCVVFTTCAVAPPPMGCSAGHGAPPFSSVRSSHPRTSSRRWRSRGASACRGGSW